METIAVYFEPVAKSYGIHTVKGVVMVRAQLSRENFLKNSRHAPMPSSAAEKFLFVMVQYETDTEASLFAVTRPEEIEGLLTSFGLPERPGITSNLWTCFSFKALIFTNAMASPPQSLRN